MDEEAVGPERVRGRGGCGGGPVEEGEGILGDGLGGGVGVPGEGEENGIDVAVGHRAGREGGGERLPCRPRLVRQVVGDVLRRRMCGGREQR